MSVLQTNADDKKTSREKECVDYVASEVSSATRHCWRTFLMETSTKVII